MTRLVRLAGIVAWLFGVALLVSACSDNPDYDERANAALHSVQLDHLHAAWDGYGRVLRLRGIAASGAERRKAEQAVKDWLQGEAELLNEIVVVQKGAAPSPAALVVPDLQAIDERIQKEVDAIFAQDVWKGREIEVTVHLGEVKLTGTALNQSDKDRITEIVTRIEGVKDVVNMLEIKP